MSDLWYKFPILKIELCQANVLYATFQTLKINSLIPIQQNYCIDTILFVM